ncbi:MAG: hypothetical protein LJU34_03895 [Oscillospiraceae bacterium]|nr:hypothetical protein [Oscillospiraceae bacterium]
MKCRKIIILLLTLTMALSLFSGAAFGSEPEENASEEAAEEIIEESALEEEASQESEEEEAFEEPAEEALTMTALEEVNAPVLTAAGEEVSGLTIGNVNIKDQTYYLVNGETLEETTSNEGYAVYYNSNTSTLTLNGLSLPTAALTVPAGTTIVVSGTSNELASIVAAGALTIQIDSALTVSV